MATSCVRCQDRRARGHQAGRAGGRAISNHEEILNSPREPVSGPRSIVKFPWRLEVGDHSWLGEKVWIDNLEKVSIGANCCISQGAYLCTGSHDWSRSTFDLITAPIRIDEGAWIAACSKIAPGVTVGEGAVLGLGSVANEDLQPWTIYLGVPAVCVRARVGAEAR
jgi:acetyltransferase-like isoleucine patch superfamily enzyme